MATLRIALGATDHGDSLHVVINFKVYLKFCVHNVCESKIEITMKNNDVSGAVAPSSIPLPNVKEHAPLSARASVDHGVEVESTGEHENRAADRGCCVSTCSPVFL